MPKTFPEPNRGVYKWIISMVAAGVIAGTQALASGMTYRNSQYGISLSYPHGLSTCGESGQTSDHGVTIFLDGAGAGDCRDQSGRRNIFVFAFYNALDGTSTFAQYREWECSAVLKARCAPGPSDLKISAISSEVVYADNGNGWIDIVVLAQSGTAKNFPRNAEINYSIGLHTKTDNLKGDLGQFRRILKTVRLFQAE